MILQSIIKDSLLLEEDRLGVLFYHKGGCVSCLVKTSMGLHNDDDDATLLSFDEDVGCFHWRPAHELLL